MQSAHDVRVRFLSAEAVLDISRRETTIGIRNFRPTQDNLVCRKIGRVRFAGCAVDKAVDKWIEVHQETPSAQWVRDKGYDLTARFKGETEVYATDLVVD